MKRWLYKTLFKKAGWTIEGNLPNLKKYIIVVAPHTSNWDFFIGLSTRAILRFDPKYVAKKELFIWPLGAIFRSLGGYPVERKKNTHFVEQMANIFKEKESFILTITPEATRSYNPNWKTGFFFVAKKANVPILPIAFDYEKKRVVFSEPIEAKGVADEFISNLKKWFSQYKGKYPEKGVRV